MAISVASQKNVLTTLEEEASEADLKYIKDNGYGYDSATREVYQDVALEPAPSPEPVEALQDDAPGLQQQASALPDAGDVAEPLDAPVEAAPSPDIESAAPEASSGFFDKSMSASKAYAAGIDPVEVSQRLDEGMLYNPAMSSFVPQKYAGLDESDVLAFEQGYSPDEIVENKAQGTVYGEGWGVYVSPEFATLNKSQVEELRRLEDKRPDSQTMKQLMFLSEAGIDLDAADDGYFQKWKQEWEGVEVNESNLREAIKRSELAADAYRVKLDAYVKEQKDIPYYARPYKALLGETTLTGDPEGIPDTEPGQYMQRLAKGELAQRYLVNTFKKALDEGVFSGGTMDFSAVKKLPGWENAGDAARKYVVSQIQGAQLEGLEKDVADREWGEILGGATELPVNVAKQMMEIGGFFAVGAKEVLYDLGASGVNMAAGFVEDLATYEEEPDVFGPSYMPSPKTQRQSALAKATNEGLDELGDIWRGAVAVGAGSVVAVGEMGDVAVGMAKGEEEAYKRFVNFTIERPVDAAGLAAGGVGIARAATGRAVINASQQAAKSSAAYNSAKSARMAAGDVIQPNRPSVRPASIESMVEDAAKTAGMETGTFIVGKEGFPVPAPKPLTDYFKKGIEPDALRKSLAEAAEEGRTLPVGDSQLLELHLKKTADEVKVAALRAKYDVQTALQKTMDPVGAFMVAGATALKRLNPAALRSLQRRDTLMDEVKIVTPEGETSLLDVVSKRNGALAEKMRDIQRNGEKVPADLLREVDDLLRLSPEMAAADAWILLPDGKEAKMDFAPREPDLQTVFGKPLTETQKQGLLNQPKVIEEQIRKSARQTSADLNRMIRDRSTAGKKLGLIEGEAEHFFALLDYADNLKSIRDLPETFEAMKKSDRNALAKSFSTRRASQAKRDTARQKMESLLQKRKGLSDKDALILEEVLVELSTINREWGSRRGRGMMNVAFKDFDAAKASVEGLLAKLDDSDSAKIVQDKARQILEADANILDIDDYAINTLDDFYRNEILLDPEVSVLGKSADDLKLVADGMQLSPSQRELIDGAIDMYQQTSVALEQAQKRTQKRRIKKKIEKRKLKQKTAAGEVARGELKEGAAETTSYIQDELIGEAKKELSLVRKDIVDALESLAKRQESLKGIKASRAVREKALEDVLIAKRTGGNGSLGEMGKMIEAGVAPKAIPAKHIALAQAMRIADNVSDPHTRGLVEAAFEQNGLSIADAEGLGPNVVGYLNHVADNYMDVSNIKDATAVYSVSPLNMVDDVKIVEIRNNAKRATETKLDIDAALANESLGDGAKSLLTKYRALKDAGEPISNSMQQAVNDMTMTVASDLRTEMFRASAAAIEEGLLTPQTAFLRIANYFPDLYAQYENFLSANLSDAALELPDFNPLKEVKGMQQYKLHGNNFKKSNYKHLPLEDRREMGLITDPAATFVLGASRIYNDILTAKMYRELKGAKFSDSPSVPEGLRGKSFAMDPDDAEWKRLGDSEKKLFRQIPHKKTEKRLTRYGELSGMYVPESLYDDVVNTAETSNWAWRAHNKFLSTWKLGNTAYNPVTQLRNHVSNWFMADMNNMLYGPGSKTSGRLLKEGDIARQAWTHQGELVEEAIAAGLFGGDLISVEVNGALGKRTPLPKDLQKVLKRGVANGDHGLERAFNVTDSFVNAAKTGKATLEMAQKNYQFGDEFYKLLRYGQIRSLQKQFLKTGTLTNEMKAAFGGAVEAIDLLGIADPVLAKKAAVSRVFNDGFVDYSRTSKAVNWLRKGWAPFITFTGEMLPKFAAKQALNPFKAMFYREAFRNLNEYSHLIDGEPTLADLEDVESKRLMMPTYSRMGGRYVGVRNIPYADGDVPMHAFMDVSLWTPMGNLLTPTDDTRGSGIFDSIPDFLTLSHPLADVIGRVVFNRSDYQSTSGTLYPTGSGADWTDKAVPALQMARRKLLPPMIGGRSLDKMYSGITGKPYGARGKVYTPGSALFDIFGGRTTNVPVDSDITDGLERQMTLNETVLSPSDVTNRASNELVWEEELEDRNKKTERYYQEKQDRALRSAKEYAIRSARIRNLLRQIEQIKDKVSE